jgi:peptidylprolyl isomerase
MARSLTIALLMMLAAGTPGAQEQGRVPPVPPDLAAPPANAEKSSTGLVSRILRPGNGIDKVDAADIITVHYTGWSADGTMFDSSITRGIPPTFPLARVLPGWRECVLLMTVGETRRCWVPQQLGYRGAAGRPRGMTVFDIELIETRRSPTIPPPDVAAPPADAGRTATGIAYKVLRPGTGSRKPVARNRVTVHYTGWTTDGKMFDSSFTRGVPTTMSLGDVILGWTEGVQLMVEGERTRFWIPESLAYKGEAGSPAGMLVFDIELVRIED